MRLKKRISRYRRKISPWKKRKNKQPTTRKTHERLARGRCPRRIPESMIVDLVFQLRRSARTFYTRNPRLRLAPTQDSNSTLKPQLQANLESVAKHPQVGTPEAAIHQRLHRVMETSPSPVPDCPNKKALLEQPQEL